MTGSPDPAELGTEVVPLRHGLCAVYILRKVPPPPPPPPPPPEPLWWQEGDPPPW